MALSLEKVGYMIEALNEYEQSPLHVASNYGRAEAVKLLLAKGVRIERRDRQCQTPLALAASSGNEELIRCFLKKGADPVHKDSRGDTPLHRAAWQGHIPMMEILIKEKEVNIDILSENGETPLYRSYYRKSAMIRILNHGANIDHVSKKGTTPLILVSEIGDYVSAKLLIERGANLYILDSDRCSALHEAVNAGHGIIASMLLDA
ncbi:ankyrin, partial [Pleomassaria siparia CBS 279.74]